MSDRVPDRTYVPVDSDRVEGRRRSWLSVLAALVAGLIVGALAGGLYGASQAKTYTASTQLQVVPDSTIIPSASGNSALNEDSASFIQPQLNVINDGDTILAGVQRQLRLSSAPDVVATQITTSYAIDISATASTPAQAIRVADATARAYTDYRQNSVTDELNAAVTRNQSQLDAIEKQLAQLRTVTGSGNATGNGNTNANTGASSPAAIALSTQYATLLNTQSQLTSSLAEVSTLVSVLNTGHEVAGGLSATVKYALLGAVIGAILGLLILIAVRRSVVRVRGMNDLAAVGVPVLLPTFVRHRVAGDGEWASSTARLLAARMVGDELETSGPVVIVGATGNVGTSYVATSIAAALADRGPVLLVQAADAVPASGQRIEQAVSTDSAPDPTLVIDEAAVGVDAVQQVVRSSIDGVWVLPGAGRLVQAAAGAGFARSRLLVDALDRATVAGWTVVVDAPSLSRSSIALDCLGIGGTMAVVVRRGRSKPADVVATTDLLEGRGVNFAGVILNDLPGRLWRRMRSSAQDPTGSAMPTDGPDGAAASAGDLSARRPATGRRQIAGGSRSRGSHAAQSQESVPSGAAAKS